MYFESSSACCSFRRSPIAVILYGGRYGTPCRTTELPTHLIPVVEMTRWFWIEMRLGATGPERVHHGLDVLLVDHQPVGVDVRVVPDDLASARP